MRYLFASAAPHPPEVYSGAECSIDELAVELRVRGHACAVVAGAHGRARRARRPDLVVTWNAPCRQVACVARDLGIPVLVWVPDVEFGRYLDQLPPVTLAAASSYVARRVEARLPRGAPPVHVMRPVIRFDAYRAAARAPKHVLADPGRATELAALGHANVARAELAPARIVEDFLHAGGRPGRKEK